MVQSRWFWLGFALSVTLGLAAVLGATSLILGNTRTVEAFSPTSPPSQALPTPLATSVSIQARPAGTPLLYYGAGGQPPQASGGTCIVGFIINRCEQAVGAGWKVTATSGTGATVSTIANANGRYRFDNLAAGTWTVVLDVPSGYRPFTPAVFQVTLTGNASDGCAQVRDKVEALACLDVTKLDANGQMGFKEIGIPGWQMAATDGNTTLIATTDAQGKCRFHNLAPGTWTVQEEAKLGWVPVNGQYQQTINLPSPCTPPGTVCGSLTFTNQQIHDAGIQVLKIDQNNNPLSGWKITVTRDDGTQPPISKLTDSSGRATFDKLALGQWTVQEEVKPQWRPLGQTAQRVDLTIPGRYEYVAFRNEYVPPVPVGCVEGYKINQLDRGLPGWTIVARNASSFEAFSTVTDWTGKFRFDHLRVGTWKISEVLQPGWAPVTSAEVEVVITQDTCKQIRFKNEIDYACVDVFKKDAHDGSGLPGWEIIIQPAFGGAAMSGTTDGIGHVRFSRLTPGTYVISEKMLNGWTAVTPPSQQVTLEASGFCLITTFENRQTTSTSP